jgi:hypothetical protein
MKRILSQCVATGIVLTMMSGWLALPLPGQVQQPRPDEAARGPAGRQPAPRRTPQPSRGGPDFLRQLMDSKPALLSDVTWDLLSRLAVQLLSGNEAELLSGNETGLLSGNEAELLSGNRAELLSGNKPQLFSGNAAKLASENEAEILSWNKINLFSNIRLTIEFSNSGSNNGNHGLVGTPTARFQSFDQNQNGKVSHDEYTTGKSDRKLRKASKRFRRLDQDGDSILTAQEFNAREER